MQYLLANNPHDLQKYGYSYLHPMGFRGAYKRQLSHCRLANSLLNKNESFLQAFKAPLVESSRTSTPVISSESFFNYPEKGLIELEGITINHEDKIRFIASLRDYLLPEFTEPHIILYVRRQDEMIQAWTNQINKRNPRFIATPGIVAERFGLSLNYERSLDCWKKIFPHAKITVRIYEKGQVEDTAVDFLSLLSITDREAFSNISHGETNSRISREAMDFINCLKRLKLPPRILNYISDIICSDSRAKNLISSHEYCLLSYAEKVAIMDHYRESNDLVAREYFNSDTLFRLEPQDTPPEPPLRILGAFRYSMRVILQLLRNAVR